MARKKITQLYSTHNEGSQLLLKELLELYRKKFKHMTSISKNVYTDKLNDIVNEY